MFVAPNTFRHSRARVEEGKSTLLERARSLAPDLVALRRDLHRHPELAFQERRTAEVVASRLEALGLTVRRKSSRPGSRRSG
jgi:metal-dependent amidase/aminoacylase/carboxypeptidase family protein